MSKGMTAKDWTARAEAFDEAAEHLDQAWTDDPLEQKQGTIAGRKIRKDAERCRQIAKGATP